MKPTMVVVALAVACSSPPPSPPVQAPITSRALYCAHGGVGIAPAGAERWFAVAVIEITNPGASTPAKVSDFSLIGATGEVTPLRRVIEVDDFDRPPVPNWGISAYYLNAGKAAPPGDRTRPWDGVLRSGTTKLRVRVSLAKDPLQPARFRLVVGSTVTEGDVNARWPT
jgi:hypothetical protein